MNSIQINGQTYEVGRVQFNQNLELMKVLKGLGNIELKTEEEGQTGLNLTGLYNSIVEHGLVGKVFAHMVKPTGTKWSDTQPEDAELCKAIEQLYEDQLEAIWEEFWQRKKKWSSNLITSLQAMLIPIVQQGLKSFISLMRTRQAAPKS